MSEKTEKPIAPAKPRKTAAKKSAAQKKTAVTEISVARTPTHEEVSALAHRYWIERGRQDGHHEQDWLRAEEELRGKAS
ncbi:MAG TPA: DUF2934 domain-containing protein [Acidobacteriaceae bacterium]|nr:DUF2934 domain-containing protein [Acidobacteriaceae bacterium]